jgi:hypothetical protein
LLTPAEPGDYNGDGAVTTNDYALWRAAFSTDDARTDGNGNGGTDAADYVMWRAHAGAQQSTELTGASSMGVPEPAGACLALASFIAISTLRRRHA